MKQEKTFWWIIGLLTLAIVIAGLVQAAGVAAAIHVLQHLRALSPKWALLLGCSLVLGIALVIACVIVWKRQGKFLLELTRPGGQAHRRWRVAALVVFVVLLAPFSIIMLYPISGNLLRGEWIHLLGFWFLVILGTGCLKIYRPVFSWPAALAFSTLIQAVVYGAATNFSFVSSYPLSLGWSEISRYYDASLFFARRLYGESVPLSVLHPTWHLLLAIPFALGNLPLWIHRLWQALLQVILPLIFSLVFSRRLNLRRGAWFVGTLLFTFLYLVDGPILINVLVCAIIVLWGIKPEKFWRTTVVVLFAALWAGVSRINWYPVPGLFAFAIYLLEVPYSSTDRKFFKYAWKPVFWFLLGLAAALLSDFLYIQLSGNAAQSGQFFSSLSSTLLWYRLFPNATYAPGVLVMIFIFSLPFWLVIAARLRAGKKEFHVLRLAGILGALLVLFLGGLVVSVKIGGGGDLHNLDAYLVLLLLVGGTLMFGKYGVERGVTAGGNLQNIVFLLLLVAIPAWMAVRVSSPFYSWDAAKAEKAVSTSKAYVEQTVAQGGQVLFISQRHLLTFGMIKAPLIQDYEQDHLMEMVMSHNRAYLDRFQADLSQQRFALIVAEMQKTNFQGSGHSFGDENDGWVQEVSIPLLCYYRPAYDSGIFGLVVYAPRDHPCK